MRSNGTRPYIIAVSALLAVPAVSQETGPSTSISPYMMPSRTGVRTTSILTVNDAKSEAALVPAGGNKLTAKDVSLPSGAKVTVSIIRKDETKLGATFQIK